MSNSGFETLIVFGPHTSGSETDSNWGPSRRFTCSSSDRDTVSDPTEEQQPAQDDEYMEAKSPTSGSETDSNFIWRSNPRIIYLSSDCDTLSDPTEEQQPSQDGEYMEAESVHGTDVAMVAQPGGIHPEPWSVLESQIFTDAVLSNPILLKSLKADEILHLKDVCKSWATWFNSSTDIIAKVRQQDESSDWYFPVLYRLATPAHLFSWTWSGIWHGTAEHSLGTQPRPLPSLDCVPRTWRKWSHPETVAIAGGLLLIRFVRDIVNVPVRTYRCKREYWEPKGYRFRYCNVNDCEGEDGDTCHHCITLDNRNWDPLMVVNPLTKAVRFLPAPVPDCEELVGWEVWMYYNLQVFMRVDDEANSYEIIFLYHEWGLVYSSTSDKWKSMRFHQAGPWRRTVHEWGYHCAGAWVGRLLFIADIRYPDDADYIRDPSTAGVLEIFEIDVEAGDWRRCNDFPLRKSTDWARIPIIDVTGLDRNDDFEDLIVLRNLELVECMGHIFAVIPARLDQYLYPSEEGSEWTSEWWDDPPRDPTYMPLQFYILQLQGDSLLHGQLRIELGGSATEWDYKSRRQNLFDKTKPENAPSERPSNWFSCVGKGSVIWVSIEDYLLQYDVVSGETRTQVIPVNWVEENMRFAYRPSFHMKP